MNFLKNIQTTGSFELASDIKPIPKGTQVQAMIKEAKWEEREEGVLHVQLTWVVLAPDMYKNRQLFHKIHVFDADDKKREKHCRMLAAINANAGGNLHTLESSPTNFELQAALQHKQMWLRLGIWQMNDSSGNWVMQVAPSGAPLETPPMAAATQLDDEIPF